MCATSLVCRPRCLPRPISGGWRAWVAVRSAACPHSCSADTACGSRTGTRIPHLTPSPRFSEKWKFNSIQQTFVPCFGSGSTGSTCFWWYYMVSVSDPDSLIPDPALQNIKFSNFFLFLWLISLPSWIRIHWPDYIRNQSGSETLGTVPGILLFCCNKIDRIQEARETDPGSSD